MSTTERMPTSKRFLQKISTFCAITSFILAAAAGGLLAINTAEASDVYKAAVGATTFFFFMVGIVLHAIGATDIPDLKIKTEK
ncbi:hypothetical protein [Thalassotalea sp. ND16A]|uniref:hypothetical protein n=1 Tax=Thalassotalea sp. ND16A TaxID=1535422 RepID=UPI000519F65B|nr:hypothetical protein [Thalassotalea sp. ND16A]KGJ88137.1 hypothetical protein ND16A_2690 [Thalassotalea sp. ND16A]